MTRAIILTSIIVIITIIAIRIPAEVEPQQA